MYLERIVLPASQRRGLSLASFEGFIGLAIVELQPGPVICKNGSIWSQPDVVGCVQEDGEGSRSLPEKTNPDGRMSHNMAQRITSDVLEKPQRRLSMSPDH